MLRIPLLKWSFIFWQLRLTIALTLNFWSFCFHLPSAGTTDVTHHAWLTAVIYWAYWMWKHICAHAWRPKNSLRCRLLGTVYCLSSASRLAWMANEHQESACVNLSRAGITTLCHHAWLLSVGSRAWTQVLVLAKQALYWWGHLISLFILKNK